MSKRKRHTFGKWKIPPKVRVVDTGVVKERRDDDESTRQKVSKAPNNRKPR